MESPQALPCVDWADDDAAAAGSLSGSPDYAYGPSDYAYG